MTSFSRLIALTVCVVFVVGASARINTLKSTLDDLKSSSLVAPEPVKVSELLKDQVGAKPDIKITDSQTIGEADINIADVPIEAASKPVVPVVQSIPTLIEPAPAVEQPAMFPDGHDFGGIDQLFKELFHGQGFPGAPKDGGVANHDDHHLDWMDKLINSLLSDESLHKDEM